ncbi:EAL domain-containing protein [Paracraurococcus ruber]|uniref:EAL domain-containing protein n=1 Tax=Paracraurococcus ruber TaxID=77675 RepID=UPI0010577BFF|nr:EAL domain-containing protein [Paracraurococcus ruber]TDG31551.1 EAL domain-containing protein [Paracraurococcus ruber]
MNALAPPVAGGAPDPALTAEDLLQFLYLIPVGVLQFGPDGTIQLLNPMASQLLLPLLAEPRLDNLFDALRDLVPDLEATLRAAGDTLGPVLDQRQIERPGRRPRLVLSLCVIRVTDGAWMAVLRDVTRLVEMLGFAFTPSDLLLDVDAEGCIGWAAGAFQALLGLSPADAVGRPLDSLVAPRDRRRLARAMDGLSARGRLTPLTLRLANARETPCSLAGMALDATGNRLCVTIGPAATPLGGARAAQQPASGFAAEAAGSLRAGAEATLGLLDIADWQDTAARLDARLLGCLQREIRHLSEEMAGEPLVFGELGAGRFGLLGPAGLDLSGLAGAVEGLLGSVLPGGAPRVSGANIPLAADGLAAQPALQSLRLLLARFAGQGVQGVPAGGLAGMLAEAETHRQALAGMIAQGRFQLAYQPILRLSDRRICHHEALIRPEAGPENPAGNPQEFVTLAEALGLAPALDLAVLDRALALLRQSTHSIAVNLSALSLGDPRFAEALLARTAGLSPGRLLLEVTETAEIEDLPSVAGTLARLRAAGLRVCLDDFGAGAASFRYLRDLRVDFVKIDGAFVRAAPQDERGRAFIMAMRDLAASCGAETIAEMVETEADAALMQQLGVQLGQGWLFGKPGPLAPQAAAPKRWRY